MHSTVTAPSLLSVSRLTTLVVSTLVSLSSGSNYVRYLNLTLARIDFNFLRLSGHAGRFW
jgi:hypothetical protein